VFSKSFGVPSRQWLMSFFTLPRKVSITIPPSLAAMAWLT
jgi:hypothetical protein